MRKTILALSLAVLSFGAYASDLSSRVTVSAASDLIYRGEDVTGSQGTVGLELEFNNVLFNGVYFSTAANTVEATPLNDYVDARVDVEAGYAGVYEDFGYSVGLARVVNPVNYVDDYTEVRVRGNYRFAYAELGQGLTDGVNQDTYFAVGVEDRLFWEPLLLGVSASVVNYDNGDTDFNNVQVYGQYDLYEGLVAEAGYSWGGNRLNLSLDDHAWVGVTYTF
jgi:hypothetical protein